MAPNPSSRVQLQESSTPAPRCLLLVSALPWAPCSPLGRLPARPPSSSAWARPRTLRPTPPPSACTRPPRPNPLPRGLPSPTAAAHLLTRWEPEARLWVHPSAWHLRPTTPLRCTSSSVWAATPRSRPPRGWCTLRSSTRFRTSCTPPPRCRGPAVSPVSASCVMIWWAVCLECLSSCFRIGIVLRALWLRFKALSFLLHQWYRALLYSVQSAVFKEKIREKFKWVSIWERRLIFRSVLSQCAEKVSIHYSDKAHACVMSWTCCLHLAVDYSPKHLSLYFTSCH